MTDEHHKKPKSIGIIMDGNRRWARGRGLPTFEGHRAGYAKLKEVLRWAGEAGVSHVIVYAFSTENWKRSKEEVSYLMDLMRTMFRDDLSSFHKEGARVRCIGQIERLPADLQESIARAERETEGNTKGTLWVALSYGGRAEILATVNSLLAGGAHEVSEEEFSNHLWTAGMPDPDMIIRTSGEKRLSGFLPWQGVYSELFFLDQHWPDFSKEDFDALIREYGERDRRQGK